MKAWKSLIQRRPLGRGESAAVADEHPGTLLTSKYDGDPGNSGPADQAEAETGTDRSAHGPGAQLLCEVGRPCVAREGGWLTLSG